MAKKSEKVKSIVVNSVAAFAAIVSNLRFAE